jgi:hypothetical protein
MVEVVLVSLAAACLHSVESHNLGQQPRHERAPVKLHKPSAGAVGHHYLVKLVGYALPAHYRHAPGIARQCLEGVLVDEELELGREPDTAQHAQRIVREGDVGV